MMSYAARAVPWVRIVVAGALVVGLMELVRWDPWMLWPLEGAAVGLLAAATAWCFDETAAAVVDPAPRGVAWRTAARAPGVLLLLGCWVAVVVHAGDAALFGQRDAVLVQGLAAVAAGAAYACWRRGRGEAAPGLLVAPVIVGVTLSWALVRPFEEVLAVFPYGTSSTRDWQLSVAGWATMGVAALLVLGAALAEAPWWRSRRFSQLAPSDFQ